MKSTRVILATSVAMLALAGCKHTSSTAGGPGDPGNPGNPGGGGSTLVQGDQLAGNEPVEHAAAVALNDGKTLKADPASNSSAVNIDWDANTAKGEKPTFSVKKNGNGGMDMTVNGQTVSFAAADAPADPADAPYGWEKNGNDYKDLYNYNGMRDGSDQGYVQVWGYTVDDGPKTLRGYGVVGLETPEDTVKTHANATYKGRARADTVQDGAPNERTGARGDLTLNADFAAGSVSGSVDNVEGRDRGAATNNQWTAWQAAPGKIILGNAAISSNGFSGGSVSLDATAAQTFGADLSGSTYSGRFYGPDADQVGGVMNIVGTNDEDKKVVGSGFLVGDKQ